MDERNEKKNSGDTDRGMDRQQCGKHTNQHTFEPLIYCSESIDLKLINTTPLQFYVDHIDR